MVNVCDKRAGNEAVADPASSYSRGSSLQKEANFRMIWSH